jgi:hypothetical protein
LRNETVLYSGPGYSDLTVERAAWTDERLDDLAEAMRTGFARVDQDMRDLRTEMRDGFKELRSEVGEVRRDLHGEIDALRQTMIRFGGGMLLGFISVLAAILARGA